MIIRTKLYEKKNRQLFTENTYVFHYYGIE